MKQHKMSKPKKVNPILEKYEHLQDERKAKIRLEPSKFKRFWKWIWFWVSFPWIWTFYNIRDWKTFIIFLVVFLVVSSEVWVPYLLGCICWSNEPFRITMFSVASACWLFWLGPGTPFMVIVITITIAIKSIFNKVSRKKEK